MGMADILLNDAETFEQTDNLFNRKPNVKSGGNWSSYFRKEDISRFLDFIHVYSPGAGADNPEEQKFCCN